MSSPADDLLLDWGSRPTKFGLKELGFTERTPEFSNWKLGFRTAKCDLSAEPMINLSMVPIVQVSGLLHTPRILACSVPSWNIALAPVACGCSSQGQHFALIAGLRADAKGVRTA